MAHWLKMGACFAALSALASPAAGPRRRRGASDGGRIVPEPGLLVVPAGGGQRRAISDRPDVLALAFEVDYWDRLGWKDTFSKAAWTARQYAYARAMARDGVYTPQVVVNGRVEGDGLEPGALAGLISRGDRGAGGPDGRLFRQRGDGRGRGRAFGRGGRLARALYPAHGRGRDPARRERRPYAAL